MARGKYFGLLLSVLVILSPFYNRPDWQDALRNKHDYFMLTASFSCGGDLAKNVRQNETHREPTNINKATAPAVSCNDWLGSARFRLIVVCVNSLLITPSLNDTR
jgi:hypothetical protein